MKKNMKISKPNMKKKKASQTGRKRDENETHWFLSRYSPSYTNAFEISPEMREQIRSEVAKGKTNYEIAKKVKEGLRCD